MGKSRRSLFSRALAGDVVSRVGQHLPEGVDLITRASRPGLGPVSTASPASAEERPAQATGQPGPAAGRGNGDEDVPPPS